MGGAAPIAMTSGLVMSLLVRHPHLGIRGLLRRQGHG